MRRRVKAASTITVGFVAAVAAIWGLGSNATAAVGDPVYLGASNNESAQGTTIKNTSEGLYVPGCNSTSNTDTALEVCAPGWGLVARGGGGVLAEAEGTGVLGYGAPGVSGIGRGGYGVAGEGDSGGVFGTGDTNGVHGRARTAGGDGVLGTHVGTSGVGVHGITNSARGIYGEATADGVGVIGTTFGGTGVKGVNTSYNGIGVHGQTTGTGSAVYGEALEDGVGVFGDSVDGPGVMARSANGVALNVIGSTRFSRSGLAVVPGTKAEPKSQIVVEGVDLAASSLVLVTPQRSRPGVFVQGAVPNVANKTVTIILNREVGVRYPVAWFVIERPLG